MPRSPLSRFLLTAIVPAVALGAQQPAAWDPTAILAAERFVRPPAAIETIVMTPRVDIRLDRLNPARALALRTTGADRGAIAAYGAPHQYLGGLNVDTRANRSRELTVSTRTGLVVVDPKTGVARALQTPAGATIAAETWSPRGDRIAYIANFPTASHAVVADVATGRSTQVTRTPLLATLVDELRFTADGTGLLVVLVPEGRGPIPTHGTDGVEEGPRVRMTGARKVPQPVHWSLLEDPHEQAQLKWYTTGQLALVDITSRRERRIGAPTMVRAADLSPDGGHLRVTRMTEPFSYLVPVSAFGSVQELWDLTGRVVATLQTTPLREESRGPDAPAAPDTGTRNVQWDPAGRGLFYLKSVFAAAPAEGRGGARSGNAGDGNGGAAGARGGRPQATAVRLMRWSAPYGPGDTALVLEAGSQLSGFAWSHDGAMLFVSDSGQAFAVRPAEPTKR
ncbi:MAG: TolB family protein, partial [Gemmatimonadota bacterium]